jgi:hypothetical protein
MTHLRSKHFACSFTLLLLSQLGCSEIDFLAKKDKAAAPQETAPVDADSKKEEASADVPQEAVEQEVKEEAPAEEKTVYQTLKPKDEIVSYTTATTIDQTDINNCLFNLAGHPFDLNSGSLTFRRIEFDKITGTLAVALNDDKPTDQPQLVLIRALETIGSELIFHLMNPKAYYCFKNIDDVGTDYEIPLHCGAKVSENIRWTDTKYKTALSVAVEDSGVYLSPTKTKKLSHEKPAGASCLPGR